MMIRTNSLTRKYQLLNCCSTRLDKAMHGVPSFMFVFLLSLYVWLFVYFEICPPSYCPLTPTKQTLKYNNYFYDEAKINLKKNNIEINI